MTDIDLIPADYRERLRLHGWAKSMTIAVSVALILSIASYFMLNYMNKEITSRIFSIQEKQQISQQQSNVLTNLNGKKNNLQHQLSFLVGLRSGTEAQAMFKTIDDAMENNEVWFLNWEFRRAGTAVESSAENKSSNGYFIIIPATDDAQTPETWKIETHMTIKGQAKDHAALSRFVRKLFYQPDINDVRIISTSRTPKARIVNFDLAVTVNSGSGTG